METSTLISADKVEGTPIYNREGDKLARGRQARRRELPGGRQPQRRRPDPLPDQGLRRGRAVAQHRVITAGEHRRHRPGER